jgi:HJR/Mrr/RecB family endonuclease
MKVIELSELDFASFNVIKEPAADIFATETGWFANDDNSLLGLTLLDKIDKDCGYIILGLDEDEAYRALEVNVSLDNQGIAESLLKKRLIEIIEKGHKDEIIYKTDTSKIIEPKSVIITDINDEIKGYFKKHPEKLYDLSPRKFEELIASILNDFGFDVELTKATRDGGRDIIAKIRNEVTEFLTYVECKKHSVSHKVGVGIIREVIGVHNLRVPTKSMIVTTSFFTKDAQKEAKQFENQLDLKDYLSIKKWLQNY